MNPTNRSSLEDVTTYLCLKYSDQRHENAINVKFRIALSETECKLQERLPRD